MALFKIFKGSSDRLQQQEFHPGYAYLTTDDGKFYIDVGEDSEIGQGVSPIIGNFKGEVVENNQLANRICINQRIFSYNDYDILDCGTANTSDEEVTIIFDCGTSIM